jgi:hypothetical protein|nr:MAG TPA: hypothetical protein [Caudoviricetes sp.]
MATRKTISAAQTVSPVLEASYILRTASSGATSARYVAENGSGRRDVEFYVPRANLEAAGGLPRRITITVTAEDGEPLPISVMDEIAALINASKDMGVPYPEKAAGALILRNYGLEHGTSSKDYAAVQAVYEECDWQDYAPVIKTAPVKAAGRPVEARLRGTPAAGRVGAEKAVRETVKAAPAPAKTVPAPIQRKSMAKAAPVMAKAAAAPASAPVAAPSGDARMDALEAKMGQLFTMLEKLAG